MTAFALILLTACGGGPRFDRPPAEPVMRAPLPAPSGEHAVGSMLLDVDDPRPADALPEGLPRVIEAQLWYPAAADADGPLMPYLPRASAIDRLAGQSWFAEHPADLPRWTTYRGAAFRDAVPAARTGGFPVVLFAPNATSPVQEYTSLLQELASRGAIVVAVEPRIARPGAIRRTSFRGRSGASLDADDLLIVLRELVAARGGVAAVARRADLTRAGVLAHGSGGAAAMELCARETVVRRCAALDARPEADAAAPVRPFLALRSASRRADDDAIEARVRAAWLTLFSRARAETRLYRLDGAGYLSATDAPWLRPEHAAAANGGDLDPERALRIDAELLSRFFEGDDAPFVAVDSAAANYAELVLES